jgi:hypothetical protein
MPESVSRRSVIATTASYADPHPVVQPPQCVADEIRMRGRLRIALVATLLLVAVPPAHAAAIGLTAAGRSLVPPGRDFAVRDSIRERNCIAGGTSVRCVEFTVETRNIRFAARLSVFIGNARRHGWTLARTRRYKNGGAVVYFKRGGFRAVLGLGTNALWSGGPVPTLVRVSLPATAKRVGLPPVTIVSHASAAAKRRFVTAANAACRSGIARLRRIARPTSPAAGAKRYRTELDRVIRSIASLTPPRGDERAVSRVLAEFRRFSQAVQSLIEAEGENALAAAAAIAVTAKRARTAAKAYGLNECAKLFGSGS